MSSHASPLSPRRDNRGGPRPGADRKSQWPAGTVVKTMRFPTVLEDELHQYACQRMAALQCAQDKAAARQAAGPPPELKQVRMEKHPLPQGAEYGRWIFIRSCSTPL